MDNDYRNAPRLDPNMPPSQLPSESNSGFWLSIGAVAVVALVAFFAFGSRMDPAQDDPGAARTSYGTAMDRTADSANDIAPTAGDTPEAAPGPVADVPVETTSPVEPLASPHSYASEEECKAATDTPCHYVTCDSIPEGKQPDEVCGPNFQKGWQAVVPAPDKTTVPEEVAPPLTGQQSAPVEPKPPLTGQ